MISLSRCRLSAARFFAGSSRTTLRSFRMKKAPIAIMGRTIVPFDLREARRADRVAGREGEGSRMLPGLPALGGVLPGDGAASARVTITVEGPPSRIVTDAGAGGYQAFPDVCRLKNGSLFCVFYAGYSHVSQPNGRLPKGGRICAIRSKDEGATWSVPSTVVDTPDDDRDPSVCCLPNG